jgi:predicted amidohydrolase
MQLAVVQSRPALADPGTTLARLEPQLARAAGADLVVLPELANSGYALGGRARALRAAEALGAGPFQDALIAACRRHGYALATGLCERDGERLFNSAVLLDGDGVRGHYRKLHLFDREREVFEPGDLGLPVFRLGGVRVGLLVCFDWMFPEAWRSLALDGAQLIAHPSNLVLPGACQQAVPAHALINRLFVATANRVGSEGDLTFTGRSLVAGPDGAVLAAAGAEEETVLAVAIDPLRALDKRVTPRNDALADRRPDTYGRLLRP